MSFWKVEVIPPEKMFIRSLEAVNPDDLEVQPSSPLLGPERMRHHTSARNGEGFKKTLVLDLDETLISSRRTPCNCDYKVRGGCFLEWFPLCVPRPPPYFRCNKKDAPKCSFVRSFALYMLFTEVHAFIPIPSNLFMVAS